MKLTMISAVAAGLLVAFPSLAAEQVKFDKTCVSTPNKAKDVCVSFNGKTASRHL